MKLKKFSDLVTLEEQSEIDKCIYIGFYLMQVNDLDEFSLDNLLSCFELLNFSKPNVSRLKKKLKDSKAIIKGAQKDFYKIHARKLKELEKVYPQLLLKREDVDSNDSILPESLFLATRGYIELLAKQINSSYEHNIFDGCAVLMRRLFEILLIHSYENLNIKSEIQDSLGNYKALKNIVDNAKGNQVLSLSRNTKESLDKIRELGNFSAHKIYYNAKRKDIDVIRQEYRAVVEELLYKSGIKV